MMTTWRMMSLAAGACGILAGCATAPPPGPPPPPAQVYYEAPVEPGYGEPEIVYYAPAPRRIYRPYPYFGYSTLGFAFYDFDRPRYRGYAKHKDRWRKGERRKWRLPEERSGGNRKKRPDGADADDMLEKRDRVANAAPPEGKRLKRRGGDKRGRGGKRKRLRIEE